MSESYSEGGAGPALAAHSKDGSARGQTSASETTGTPASNETAGQANGTTNNTTSSVYRTARESAGVVSERAGQGIEQATQFVRDQPAFTLVLTGFLCLMLGILLGRR